MESRKEIRFNTWEELKKAALGYEKLGIRTEVRGWDAISQNILTVFEDGKEFTRV